jgi:hypothetical protein
MTRKQRQLYHARKLPFFSMVPLPTPSPVDGDALQFRAWNEPLWRKLSHKVGDRLSRDIESGREFREQVDNYLIHSGLPSPEEVERCDNTIVLTVRGSWAGLAARINPVLNAFLNRFAKCWNRSLIYTCIRLSSYGLPWPSVSIDFHTADVATLNFGQKDDCMIMTYIYELVRKTYPKAKIILLSVCLGGLRILNWLSRNPNPQNLIAVILESPLPSFRHLLQGIFGSYFNDDLYHTICMVVPNFRPELDNQYSFFRPMKRRGSEKDDNEQVCKVPLFLGMIETDTFSNKTHLPLFCDRFPNLTVFTATADDNAGRQVDHGKLYSIHPYHSALQTFLHHIQKNTKLC